MNSLKLSKNNPMRMKKAIQIMLVLVFALPSILLAQDSTSVSERKFGIHSIGVGAGLYNPFLNFFVEGSATKDWTTKFKAAPIYAANVEIDIYKNFRIRVEGSYWKQTSKNDKVSDALGGGTQELAITLMPITGTLILNILPKEKVKAYVGIGGGTVLVKTNYKKVVAVGSKIGVPVDEEVKGKGVQLSIIQGLDIPLAAGLRLGIEARFVFGDYNQEFNKNPTKQINLQGLQGLVSLNYAFGN